MSDYTKLADKVEQLFPKGHAPRILLRCPGDFERGAPTNLSFVMEKVITALRQAEQDRKDAAEDARLRIKTAVKVRMLEIGIDGVTHERILRAIDSTIFKEKPHE